MTIALSLSRAGWTALRVLAVLAVIAAAAIAAADTTRVSVDSSGAEANAGSSVSSLSADGSVVTFASTASNLVPGDTNGASDVFVHDRTSGMTERVSVDSAGAQVTGASTNPVLSGDGNTVAFVSTASNLVAGDTNGRLDVFVHDRATGMTERVSVASDGSQASSDSFSPSLSHDGGRVAFASLAANLVPGDSNATFDVFVHDRTTATTVRVSVDSAGMQAGGASFAPRLSADGLTVVFHSQASNLVAGDTNGVSDVFVHDLASGVTSRVSVGPLGIQGNLASSAGTLSADGRMVGFNSDANNLVAGDTNGATDVFVHDRMSGMTERVSVASDGGQSDMPSGFVDPPSLSADGRRVAFSSAATNLVAMDGNNAVDFFVHDRVAGSTERLSVASDGSEANGPSVLWATLSADGSAVAFASLASNLVADDSNFAQDIFVRAGGCGDGLVQPGEDCDDGGREDGDCCSASCTFEASGASCDDADRCTQVDACDGMGACVGDAPVVCADAGPCRTTPACDPSTGACGSEALPDGSDCDDGDACTPDDACAAGECQPGPLDPESCLDPSQCYKATPFLGGAKPTERTLADLFGEALYRIKQPTDLCTAVEVRVAANQAGAPTGVVAPADRRAMQACFALRTAETDPPQPEFVERQVRVMNRLGEQTIAVERPVSLCLPAGDRTAPAAGMPQTCYEVDVVRSAELGTAAHSRRRPSVPVKLKDRYRLWSTQMFEPEMLCAPNDFADGSEVRDDVAWVCFAVQYQAFKPSHFFWPRTQRAATSLASNTKLTLWRPEAVCMPSSILEVGPMSDG